MRQAPDSGVPRAENAVQITAECLRTWGVIFLLVSAGQVRAALAA